MRKVKRFAAIVLTAALLSPTTAFAGNVEDAKALYEQVTEKQKSVTDMNAYYDYQIHLSGSALEGVEDLSNMRLEMNVRMNHLTDMGNLQYSSYSRATVPGQEPMISTMYYKDGTCYMETAGTKIKYPMDLTQMAEQISSQTMMLASGAGRSDDRFPPVDRGRRPGNWFCDPGKQDDRLYGSVIRQSGNGKCPAF